MPYKDPKVQADYQRARQARLKAAGVKQKQYGTPAERVEAAQQWRLENLERSKLTRRNGDLMRKYGITAEGYNRLLLKQNGVCAICALPPSSGTILAVDHCHETNKVRGLLCGSCNNGLGRFKDSIEILYNGIDYLARHQSPL